MHKEEKEFGGTPGAIGLMIFSHFVPFYFALSLRYSSGGLYYPSKVYPCQRKTTDNIRTTVMHSRVGISH